MPGPEQSGPGSFFCGWGVLRTVRCAVFLRKSDVAGRVEKSNHRFHGFHRLRGLKRQTWGGVDEVTWWGGSGASNHRGHWARKKSSISGISLLSLHQWFLPHELSRHSNLPHPEFLSRAIVRLSSRRSPLHRWSPLTRYTIQAGRRMRFPKTDFTLTSRR